MLIQRANRYCAEPTAYQARAMGQWVGACRFVYNIGLEQSARARGTTDNPGKSVARKSGLNRSILDQARGMIATFLAYKLMERGGIPEFVKAPYTSQACPPSAGGCGHVHPGNRRGRVFCCLSCGFGGHADVVAAINISQTGALAVEPPKRIRKRAGKRKPVEGITHAA